jgi:homoserine kinase
MIEAGVNAGALGGFLSGSGSAVCCLALEGAEHVGDAMRAAWHGPAPAELRIVSADNRGAHRVAAG